jgi:hypothetical protein
MIRQPISGAVEMTRRLIGLKVDPETSTENYVGPHGSVSAPLDVVRAVGGEGAYARGLTLERVLSLTFGDALAGAVNLLRRGAVIPTPPQRLAIQRIQVGEVSGYPYGTIQYGGFVEQQGQLVSCYQLLNFFEGIDADTLPLARPEFMVAIDAARVLPALAELLGPLPGISGSGDTVSRSSLHDLDASLVDPPADLPLVADALVEIATLLPTVH